MALSFFFFFFCKGTIQAYDLLIAHQIYMPFSVSLLFNLSIPNVYRFRGIFCSTCSIWQLPLDLQEVQDGLLFHFGKVLLNSNTAILCISNSSQLCTPTIFAEGAFSPTVLDKMSQTCAQFYSFGNITVPLDILLMTGLQIDLV